MANLCRGLLWDTSLYRKSIIMQIEWASTCNDSKYETRTACALYELKIHHLHKQYSETGKLMEWEALHVKSRWYVRTGSREPLGANIQERHDQMSDPYGEAVLNE